MSGDGLTAAGAREADRAETTRDAGHTKAWVGDTPEARVQALGARIATLVTEAMGEATREAAAARRRAEDAERLAAEARQALAAVMLTFHPHGCGIGADVFAAAKRTNVVITRERGAVHLTLRRDDTPPKLATMARDEILALPVGERLDELVATHVFVSPWKDDDGKWPRHSAGAHTDAVVGWFVKRGAALAVLAPDYGHGIRVDVMRRNVPNLLVRGDTLAHAACKAAVLVAMELA